MQNIPVKVRKAFAEKEAYLKGFIPDLKANADGIYRNPDGSWQCHYSGCMCAQISMLSNGHCFETHGGICQKWYEVNAQLGLPISDEEADGADCRISHFEHGDIRWVSNTNVCEVVPLREKKASVKKFLNNLKESILKRSKPSNKKGTLPPQEPPAKPKTPPKPQKKAVKKKSLICIDGSNVIMRRGRKPRVEILRAIMVALEGNGYRVKTFVDKSVFPRLMRYEDEDGVAFLKCGEKKGVVTVAPSKTEADGQLLQLVKFEKDAHAISNDRYRDYVEMHPWIKDDNGKKIHGFNLVPMEDGVVRVLIAGFNLDITVK